MNQRKQQVEQLSIAKLLTDDARYLIPMYQRNYAWGESEITQLIKDINDNKDNTHYYIGSLVVYQRSNGCFEVIDGQQRFTTIVLLAIYLAHTSTQAYNLHNLEDKLDFECRKKSKQTLVELINQTDISTFSDSNIYNANIVLGYRFIKEALDKISRIKFSERLFSHVQIMRVIVPAKTNLNQYFEVMNNRGEQLEKHEILKAKLLEALNNNLGGIAKQQASCVFNKVWNACANMERYLHFGFTTTERFKLFNQEKWQSCHETGYKKLATTLCNTNDNDTTQGLSIKDILDPSFTIKNKDATKDSESNDDQQSPQRFNSIVNFPNFLLHVLRVFTKKNVTLNDKNLIDEFETHLLKNDNSTVQIKGFIYALFKCKFMFDQYIIKRDFAQSDGDWSLKSVTLKKDNKIDYVNSFKNNKSCLMLQAAFHVSTPTQTYKHWLNAALYYLFKQESVYSTSYLNYLKKTAKRFVFNRYLAKGDSQSYFDMIYNSNKNDYPKNIEPDTIGQNKLEYLKIENNFVFNYLDYLLWRNEMLSDKKDKVITNFKFTFRSSVEHFFPQHPKDKSLTRPKGLHHFGNLCLISHSKNSALSNYSPKAKLDHFNAGVKDNKIDSLKLYDMISRAKKAQWDDNAIKNHQQAMIKVLCKATKTIKPKLILQLID